MIDKVHHCFCPIFVLGSFLAHMDLLSIAHNNDAIFNEKSRAILTKTREEISPRTAAVEVAALSDLDLGGQRSLKGMTLICH